MKYDKEHAVFVKSLIEFTRHEIDKGQFGAGLECYINDMVADVVWMLLYEDKKATRRVEKKLKQK